MYIHGQSPPHLIKLETNLCQGIALFYTLVRLLCVVLFGLENLVIRHGDEAGPARAGRINRMKIKGSVKRRDLEGYNDRSEKWDGLAKQGRTSKPWMDREDVVVLSLTMGEIQIEIRLGLAPGRRPRQTAPGLRPHFGVGTGVLCPHSAITLDHLSRYMFMSIALEKGNPFHMKPPILNHPTTTDNFTHERANEHPTPHGPSKCQHAHSQHHHRQPTSPNLTKQQSSPSR